MLNQEHRMLPLTRLWDWDLAATTSLHSQSVRVLLHALPFSALIGHYIVSSVFLIYTRRDSLSRRFSLLPLLFLFMVQAGFSPLLSINRIGKACLTMVAFMNLLHTCNLLILLGVDAADIENEVLYRPPTCVREKVCGALYLLCSFRGIRTKWQAKNTPIFPSFFGDSKSPNPLQFCVRQGAIAVWQLLANAVILLYLQNGVPPKSTCVQVIPAVVEFLGLKLAVWPIAWLSFFRMLIDSTYRLVSVVSVATGISDPTHWPPAFNSILDVWTLRRFWGLYWHQWLRWPFTAAATLFTQRVLRMSRPTLLRRYIHTFCVFTLSGLLHLVNDIYLGVHWQQSGSLLFFCSFTLGFVIEDSIEALWVRFERGFEPKDLGEVSMQMNHKGQAAKVTARSTRVWQKVLGALWVWSWMSVTTPVYVVPMIQSACHHRVVSDMLQMTQYVDPGMGVLALGIGALYFWLNFQVAL
ncbi:hypothetical protein N7530_010545 [Penicillium desertorum]|uniref:Wax synthase domain-containing protein n=1 Tax=Penicillium desertorum TaxID=1303715 RepID=A0A9W9WHM6_9EURO|nr:hypothetical protein N7530_010545 [Penicillium desertorum]